jgi:hypothetical protein
VVETVCGLYRHPQLAIGQQPAETLQSGGIRAGHDREASGAFAQSPQRRGGAAVGFERSLVDAERLRRVGDKVDDGVDAFGPDGSNGGGNVAVAVHQFVDLQFAQIGVVLGACWCDHMRARPGGELHGEAAHASGGADHENALALRSPSASTEKSAVMPASGAAPAAAISTAAGLVASLSCGSAISSAQLP